MANKTLFILCYHLWTINILSISFILVVLKENNILLKMPLTKLLTKLKKNVKAWLKDFPKELEYHFVEHQVMITPIVVYPQYWAINGQSIEEKFHIHLSVLKATFCVPYKVVGESVKCFPILFSSKTLDM